MLKWNYLTYICDIRQTILSRNGNFSLKQALLLITLNLHIHNRDSYREFPTGCWCTQKWKVFSFNFHSFLYSWRRFWIIFLTFTVVASWRDETILQREYSRVYSVRSPVYEHAMSWFNTCKTALQNIPLSGSPVVVSLSRVTVWQANMREVLPRRASNLIKHSLIGNPDTPDKQQQ